MGWALNWLLYVHRKPAAPQTYNFSASQLDPGGPHTHSLRPNIAKGPSPLKIHLKVAWFIPLSMIPWLSSGFQLGFQGVTLCFMLGDLKEWLEFCTEWKKTHSFNCFAVGFLIKNQKKDVWFSKQKHKSFYFLLFFYDGPHPLPAPTWKESKDGLVAILSSDQAAN